MSVRRQSKERQILMPSAPSSCDVRSEIGVLVGEAPSRCSTHVLGTVEQLNFDARGSWAQPSSATLQLQLGYQLVAAGRKVGRGTPQVVDS